MYVTELGMVTEVRPLHPLKASYSMLFTELGIVMEVRSLHQEKASCPMLVTEYVFPSYRTDGGITISPLYFSLPDVTSTVKSEVTLYSMLSTLKPKVLVMIHNKTVNKKSCFIVMGFYYLLPPKHPNVGSCTYSFR